MLQAEIMRFCTLVDRAAAEQQRALEESGGGWKNGQKSQDPINTPALNRIRANLQHHIKWILRLCEVHDGMRRLIGNAFDIDISDELLHTKTIEDTSNKTSQPVREIKILIEFYFEVSEPCMNAK